VPPTHSEAYTPQTRTPDARDRRSDEQSQPGLTDEQATNRSQNLDVIIARAEAELSAIDDDVDAADNRIYAFLALNVVLAFGLIGLRDTLQPWWWTPLLGLGLSTASFCSALLPREYDYGPNIETFYRTWLYATPDDLRTQLIGELYGAIGKNRRLLKSKSRPFYIGFVFLAVTVVAGGVFVGLTTAFHHA
jgi:hypothetical protein